MKRHSTVRDHFVIFGWYRTSSARTPMMEVYSAGSEKVVKMWTVRLAREGKLQGRGFSKALTMTFGSRTRWLCGLLAVTLLPAIGHGAEPSNTFFKINEGLGALCARDILGGWYTPPEGDVPGNNNGEGPSWAQSCESCAIDKCSRMFPDEDAAREILEAQIRCIDGVTEFCTVSLVNNTLPATEFETDQDTANCSCPVPGSVCDQCPQHGNDTFGGTVPAIDPLIAPNPAVVTEPVMIWRPVLAIP